MRPPVIRLLSALLAVAIHLAILAPAWLGPDTLAGGVGGKPDSGASMVVSLAQRPKKPEPVVEKKASKEPEPQALKTEREPEPEEEKREPEPEEQPEQPTPEKPPEQAQPDSNADRMQERKRKAGDGRPSGVGAHTVGRDDDAWNRYLGELRRVIERHKTYPRQARLRRQEGEVRVRFRLDGEGRTTAVELVDESGSTILDSHVRQLLERLEFPEPPRELDIAGRAITLPVRFSLN